MLFEQVLGQTCPAIEQMRDTGLTTLMELNNEACCRDMQWNPLATHKSTRLGIWVESQFQLLAGLLTTDHQQKGNDIENPVRVQPAGKPSAEKKLTS